MKTYIVQGRTNGVWASWGMASFPSAQSAIDRALKQFSVDPADIRIRRATAKNIPAVACPSCGEDPGVSVLEAVSSGSPAHCENCGAKLNVSKVPKEGL